MHIRNLTASINNSYRWVYGFLAPACPNLTAGHPARGALRTHSRPTAARRLCAGGYKFPTSDDTTVLWVAAWAPSVSGCQHTQPAQNKAPGGVLGPFGGNPTKIGSFSSAAKSHYSLLWCRQKSGIFLGLFWPFLLVRAVSAKTATFWPRSHQNARLTAQCDGT